MTESAESFNDQLARARQGDPTALAELARQYEPEVRIVARVLLGPALRPYLDSFDLVQSVHRTLLEGLRENRFALTSPEQLIALCLTMVRRKVAHHWRRARRQRRFEDRHEEDLAGVLVSLSSPHGDPARTAQAKDQVQRVLDTLDALDRQVIEKRLAGFSTAEVARELNMDSGHLRVRMARVRQRLHAQGILEDLL